jgi:hypothetical protein
MADEEKSEKTVFVADAATAPASSIELFRSTAPRFTGHGLFHVLTELLPDAAGSQLKVRHPQIWDTFKRRWAATPALRLLWYAPEDSVGDEDPLPVGAARFLYVSDYADLTPRTWRHVLAPLVQRYKGCSNLVCDHTQPAKHRAIGSVIKQYLVLHEVDAAVVSHKRGGILYLLNATPECTVGQLPVTVSQIPLTMCVIFDRQALPHAHWRVLQHKLHRAQRLLRLDAVASHEVLERYMCATHDAGDTLTWSALLLGATDPASLKGIGQCLETRSKLASCNVFLHCDTLRIDASKLRSEDLPGVWALARLVAWLMMVPTQLQHTRNITFVDLAPEHHATLQTLIRRNSPADEARALATEPLRQLYVGLAHKLLALTAPITVLYMYSNPPQT